MRSKKICLIGGFRGNNPERNAYTGAYAGFHPANSGNKGVNGMEENTTLFPPVAGERTDLEDLIYEGDCRTVSDR